MVSAARQLELSALALADRDGLYGIARAHIEASKYEQRLIVGAELTLEADPAGGGNALSPIAPERLILLAETHEGYSNICQLLTEAHAEHEKGEAGISPEAIARHHDGLSLIVPLAQAPSELDHDWLAVLAEAYGERISIAVWRHRDGLDARREAAAVALAQRLSIPIVATSRPKMHHRNRKPLADVMHCIRHKTTLDEAGRALGPNAQAVLRSPSQMQAIFFDHPEWLEQSLAIADRCRFRMSQLRYRFPSDELCLPGENPNQALRRHVEEGKRKRYPDGAPRRVEEQIEKELALIERLDVAPYFLSVQQVVEMARRRQILCQGRGSAANSAVCFVLGVTAVDPARSNLLFERFLSAERAEPPDIDVDFEHERREEVIQELYETYGRDRAAMVSEVIAYRGKSALREVGKAFGLSLDQVDRLSKTVMHYSSSELTAERVEEQGLDPDDRRIQQVVMIAESLNGFPRHLSIHVGGFVLSSDPLHRVAPVEPARMEGRTVIPWDKDDLDALGFFKVDVLALGMLTAIRKALELLHARRAPRGPYGELLPNALPFDPIGALAKLPAEDARVYEAISRADTVGVFQIESRAQMSMLPRLRPACFYDLVIEVAIVRPGPIQGGMVHPYLRRRQGKEPTEPPHPMLGPILERTLGVPLFQEQVMQIAMVGASYSAGEADQLRRDMAAWKKHGRLERHRDRLLRGFAENGIAQAFGEGLFKQIQGFAEYGFPESHAASFALLVYASAWIKTHFPSTFVCAILNSQPMGFYSPSSLVRDAQAHGVRVAPVTVAQSYWDHTLEPDTESSERLRLRLGFRLVRGLGAAAAEAIQAARLDKPFVSMADFIRRTGLRQNEIEALAEAGALEVLQPGRREALWEAHAPRVEGLFEGVDLAPSRKNGSASKRFRTLAPVEQLVLDYARVGLSIDDHPMNHVRKRLTSRRVVKTEELSRMRDRQIVEVAGLVIGRQRPMTASGVTFITLEDETGIANLVVTEKVFSENYLAARHGKILWVRGRLEIEGQVIHVLVQALERIDRPESGALDARSRDFH